MKNNIWQSLKKPIMILAPMEEVTDTVFRQIVGSCGAPDLYFTEFTSVEGMNHKKGIKHIQHRLFFTEKERPIIAQIWGTDLENFTKAAEKIKNMGFDGIDINMGCPEKNVVKNGCCSALIKNPEKAAAIIQAVKDGAGNLPVSVKTRIGFSTIQTEEWIGFLLKQDIAAITIHGRTQKEMSEVPAHWDEIGKAVKLRDQISPETIIIGNGDVQTLEEAHEKVKEYNVDGIMVGRGIFRNVFFFNPQKPLEKVTVQERLEVLLRHVDLFTTTWVSDDSRYSHSKNYHILKKFFKAYVNNFPGAAELRNKLMQTETINQIRPIINDYLLSPDKPAESLEPSSAS